MKISVIIPYKNAERWIKGCLDSCLRQEGDLEFIFVNDGEAKSVPAVLKSCRDHRVIRRNNKWCPGVSGARNTGIYQASGEWLTFLDVDDELLPEAWKIFGFMTELDDTINVVQANHYGGTEASDRIRCAVNERGMYGPGNLPRAFCMVWNKLYRRSFLEEHNIRFKEGMQYGEDEIFNLRCMDADPRILCTQSRTCTVFHRYNNQESLSHVKTREDLLHQSQALENFLTECRNATLRHDICIMLSERWSHRLMEAWCT